MEGLNAEQRSQLEMFNEVTANSRETSGAIQLLQACNWNVEQALTLHWTAGDDAASTATATSGAAASSGGPASSTAAADLATPLLAEEQGNRLPVVGAADRGGVNIFGGAVSRSGLVGRLVSGAWRFGATVLQLICTFVFGGANTWIDNGQASGALLRRSLTAQYGQQGTLPNFFDGSFAQALETARRDAKLLIVYLHSENGRYTRTFCTEVLTNEFVRLMLDENFLLWGGDICTMESHRVAEMIHARQYPCFCVLLPASIDEIRVIGALNGAIQVDATVALLTSCLEEMSMHRSEIIARREQYSEDRSLREDQDREFQEALAFDRSREEAAKLEEDRLREATSLAEEQQRKEAEEAATVEAKRLEVETQRRRKASALEPPGPDAKGRISIRLPAGQRVERKFISAATLGDVYEWAECLPYMPENAEKGLVVPERFMLKTSFPSRNLTEMDRSIQELQLSGTMVLLAEIEDDD